MKRQTAKPENKEDRRRRLKSECQRRWIASHREQYNAYQRQYRARRKAEAQAASEGVVNAK